MPLNDPQSTPYSLPMEKLSSTKPAPGAKKVGDHYYKNTKTAPKAFAQASSRSDASSFNYSLIRNILTKCKMLF